jgi:putative membrane protein
MDYRETDPNRMILRDHLARDRTVLANERTLLAYVRTAIALLAAGGTLLKVFWGNTAIAVVGGFLLALGVMAAGLGIWRFRVIARRLRRLGDGEDATYPKSD